MFNPALGFFVMILFAAVGAIWLLRIFDVI